MDFERGNLELLFRWMPSEYITLKEIEQSKKNDCFHVSRERFLEQCHHAFPFLSVDEQESAYELLLNQMREKECYPGSVFQLILNLSENFIVYNSDTLYCRYEQLLRWREISLHLGQDFFVCAYLADHDIKWNLRRKYFNWAPVLLSDNGRVSSLLQKGIAENHFHLKGSSHVFYTNWIALMNNPTEKQSAFRAIKKTLHSQQYDWQKRGEELYQHCLKAAFYRMHLFSAVTGDTYIEKLIKPALYRDCQLYMSQLQSAIEWANWKYGIKFVQGGCVDYALATDICDSTKVQMFEGERKLLYLCYLKCFNNKFSAETQRLFYLYLKYCIEFRGEIIQANDVVGFENFAEYQSRKEEFIPDNSIYKKKFLQVAVFCALSKPYLTSLEMRITPGKTAKEFRDKLKKCDKIVNNFPDGAKRTRYVIHFPKQKEKNKGFGECRNGILRRKLKKQAQTIVHAMELYEGVRGRIVGIDACASEIGCRPEVFGQIYRYLQHVPCKCGFTRQTFTHLAATYHVGEDFLDIVDGLRAVDEVLHFCGFHRGNRIGHGIALGLDPVAYYRDRANTIVLPKQVLLDDIAWIIHKAKHLSVKVESSLEEYLNTRFTLLFCDIFSTAMKKLDNVTIEEYYNSWLLRGDNPDVYKTSFSHLIDCVKHHNFELDTWEKFAFNGLDIENSLADDNDLDYYKQLRSNEKLYWLNRLYHYDSEVRKTGDDTTKFKVDASYVELVYQIQDGMIKELSQKGIAIETNPSSNYLIGRIKRYDKHPILRFNARKLRPVEKNHTLSVSINTDDLGIFDTSLENEYALMALALEKAKNIDGTPKYDREDIYEWLDYVRNMGLEQSFFVNQMIEPIHLADKGLCYEHDDKNTFANKSR